MPGDPLRFARASLFISMAEEVVERDLLCSSDGDGRKGKSVEGREGRKVKEDD